VTRTRTKLAAATILMATLALTGAGCASDEETERENATTTSLPPEADVRNDDPRQATSTSAP
jgi:hypothetical protein